MKLNEQTVWMGTNLSVQESEIQFIHLMKTIFEKEEIIFGGRIRPIEKIV